MGADTKHQIVDLLCLPDSDTNNPNMTTDSYNCVVQVSSITPSFSLVKLHIEIEVMFRGTQSIKQVILLWPNVYSFELLIGMIRY